MKRIVIVGLVLAAGLGLSACGSHPATQSYIDGWDSKAQFNTYGTSANCEDIYLGSSDIHSEFIAGCEDAGDSRQTYAQSH